MEQILREFRLAHSILSDRDRVSSFLNKCRTCFWTFESILYRHSFESNWALESVATWTYELQLNLFLTKTVLRQISSYLHPRRLRMERHTNNTKAHFWSNQSFIWRRNLFEEVFEVFDNLARSTCFMFCQPIWRSNWWWWRGNCLFLWFDNYWRAGRW